MSEPISTTDFMFVTLFRLHDWTCDFLVRHAVAVKRLLLLLAHLSLFGFFFPEFRKSFGSAAEYLLLFILFLSPLSRIFRMRLLLLLVGFRRQMGICMAYLATVHGVGFLIDPIWAPLYIKPYAGANFFAMDIRYIFGIIAYLLTLPLLLTSNTFANRILGKYWKRIHRIVYVVLGLVLLHVMLLDRRNQGIEPGQIVQAALYAGAYVTLKLLAWKNFFPPLERVIANISNRYQAFRALPRPASLPTSSAGSVPRA